MIAANRIVTQTKKQATDRLPDFLTDGAILVEGLEGPGVVREVAERLRVRREGGYHGVDIVVFLVLLFAARERLSIKEFGELTRLHRRQLGALASRKMLPSPPSVSRVLAAVDDASLREFTPWLLLEGADALDCLGHPSVTMRDCRGQSWHVFDFDPTVTVLRQRALPEGDDLPVARRRSDEAAPGYPGRKRGDVQMSRATLQHAGSGLWLGIWTQPGNGSWRLASAAAIETVARTCRVLGHDTQRALIRVDGAAGNTPFIAACRAAKVSYLTRSAHYTLLQDPAIAAYLDAADWFAVEDSRSGPTRHAVDLGWHVLPSKSLDENSEPFEPVKSRIVVSRFPSKGARGSGWFDGGWCYEMYLTDLPADVMPAPEVVTCYYQRTGIENRFRQEDRELGLDRIFSYHIPGQNLANLVGLLVWNLRICRGLTLAQTLPELPAQAPRVAPPNQDKVAMIETTEGDAVDESPAATCLAVATALEELPSESDDEETLAASLERLDWPDLMAQHEGWSWSSETGGLICPAGKHARIRTVTPRVSDACGALRFTTAAADCRACRLRSACTDSDAPTFRKEKWLPVPLAQAEEIDKLLPAARTARRARRRARTTVDRTRRRRAEVAHSWTPPAPEAAFALFAVVYAVLLPAALRRLFTTACRSTDVHVDVVLSSDAQRCDVYATTHAHRQRRRLTWDESIARNAVSPETSITITMATSDVASARLYTLSRERVASARRSTH